MDKSLVQLILDAEQNDRNGNTTSSRYVTVSMRDDIDTTEAYINSKHISGDTDALGREKPFFNICVGQRNIWFRATDIDRKNVAVRPTKESDEISAFVASIHLQEWMRKENFGRFLNDWGLSLASHGSSIVKFVEQDGELKWKVVDWNTVLCDAVDFENNPVIEKLWFTPAQLRRQGYDSELVEKLLESTTVRKTMDGQAVDLKDDYILVYEIHGELPLSYLTGNEKDDDKYAQQMHVVTIQEKKDKDGNDETEAHSLFSGREAKNPYLLTHLIKKDGLTYAGGAVKNLFEAQWMVNQNEKFIKDQLELASKILFQTADGNLAGQNALTNLENGDILLHTQGNPITQLSNRADISAMQASRNDWQIVSNQINGVSEAMLGQNPPSGTAWRQTQALLNESHSLFEVMTENKRLHLEDILRKFVIPYLKKKMDTTDELAAVLDERQLKELDSRYVPNEVIRMVNKKKIDTILSGEIYDPGLEGMNMVQAEQMIQGGLKGNQRFIKPSDVPSETWNDAFKDLEWDLEVDVGNENRDIQGAMATLTTIFQTLVTNPAVLNDPNVKTVFGKILQLTGTISPLEIQASPVPVMAPGVGGAESPMAQLTK